MIRRSLLQFKVKILVSLNQSEKLIEKLLVSVSIKLFQKYVVNLQPQAKSNLQRKYFKSQNRYSHIWILQFNTNSLLVYILDQGTSTSYLHAYKLETYPS